LVKNCIIYTSELNRVQLIER